MIFSEESMIFFFFFSCGHTHMHALCSFDDTIPGIMYTNAITVQK